MDPFYLHSGQVTGDFIERRQRRNQLKRWHKIVSWRRGILRLEFNIHCFLTPRITL